MRKTNYNDMTREELEQELREAFFYSDRIDDALAEELERIRLALERKRPTEYLYTPEEAWERFCAENPEALESLAPSMEAHGADTPGQPKKRRVSALVIHPE